VRGPQPELPYRGVFGAARPTGLDDLALPPSPMPSHQGLRPLKAWRYVGVFGPELMLCAGVVRIGRARQTFWAVWDRRSGRLHERTSIGRGAVALAPGRLEVRDSEVQIDLALAETGGIETVCPAADSYAWTRKQAGIAARGAVMIGGQPLALDGVAVIDDTAAYYPRHTRWRWSAGVGTARDGRPVAWNLVDGVNDPPRGSERTAWVDGVAAEVEPAEFAPDLSGIHFASGAALRFHAEAIRERREDWLLVRSAYRQPFGTFSGELPGRVELGEGYGVMEEHDVHW
jgi:hypothetical protein